MLGGVRVCGARVLDGLQWKWNSWRWPSIFILVHEILLRSLILHNHRNDNIWLPNHFKKVETWRKAILLYNFSDAWWNAIPLATVQRSCTVYISRHIFRSSPTFYFKHLCKQEKVDPVDSTNQFYWYWRYNYPAVEKAAILQCITYSVDIHYALPCCRERCNCTISWTNALGICMRTSFGSVDMLPSSICIPSYKASGFHNRTNRWTSVWRGGPYDKLSWHLPWNAAWW